MADLNLRVLERPEEMAEVEHLQRLVWSGSETEVVPAHMLLAAVHNGGLVIGAYEGGARPFESEMAALGETDNRPAAKLVGFVFGFPGLIFTAGNPRPKHHSHMLGVHPDYRDRGIGFRLKRAQWQMVRHQGLGHITWTYDPLLSRNAYLNITRLGAVCNIYRRNEYGEMRDDFNAGLASDRFQVDWWLNSARVVRRLSKRPRIQIDLAHCLAAGAEIINPSQSDDSGHPRPAPSIQLPAPLEIVPRGGEAAAGTSTSPGEISGGPEQASSEIPLLLLEIPADFGRLKADDPGLASEWRLHTRSLFEALFAGGYLVTDFIYLAGKTPRSFYVLSHGESTL